MSWRPGRRCWGAGPGGRARRPLAETDPGLVPALLALAEDGMRGDPCSPLAWTTRSVRNLAGELARQGHRVSQEKVAQLLRGQGFSLQANAKTIEGRQHPDRDAQFRYIAAQASEHMAGGQPVISVDAKKKEQVGPYARAGREWRPQGEPAAVRDHDFPDKELGKVTPYGVYDVAANAGFVNVGTDHDTAAFAVESVRRWWEAAGRRRYPAARRLLITADAGGSNGYRTRAWKTGLAVLAAQTGLEITCCHFPPGTSKWNKIEHRLFSQITMNWRGRPLTSHEVILNTIAATTTTAGLTVTAALDTGRYPTGTQITAAQMKDLEGRALTRHDFHGTWNYTLHPAPPARPDPPPAPARPARSGLSALASPALTGMPRHDLDALAAALGTPPRPARLSPADQVLATCLHDRLGVPLHVLAYLAGVHPSTISPAITRTRRELAAQGITITPGPARLATLATLRDYATAAGITLPEPGTAPTTPGHDTPGTLN
jgi:DDE family transposase